MSGKGERLRRYAVAAGDAVDRLVAWTQGRSIARAAWFNAATPVALLVPLLVALPLALTGPLRVIVGWSMPATLPLALALSLLAVMPIWMWWRARRPSSRSWWLVAVPTAVALFAIFVLYRRAFAGLTNYAGGDAGIHVAQKNLFVGIVPGVYQGFVTMYALVYWLEAIVRCNDFWGFCALYYFGVAAVAALAAGLCLVAIEPYRGIRGAYAAGVVAAFVASIAIEFLVILPQQHYHQTDGFLTHLFGLVPLFLLWLADAVTEARLWRWAALLAGAVLYRYTYGLNLGDLMIAVGALLFVDSFEPGVPLPLRWLARVAPFVLTYLASLVYVRLEPELQLFGWIVPYEIRTALTAEAIACAGLVIASFIARSTARTSAKRLFRFPVVFGAINAVVALHIMRLPPRQPYYLLKYPVHGVVLLAAAWTVAATLLVSAGVDALAQRGQRRKLLWALAAAPLLYLALMDWRRAYEPLQQTFRERVFGQVPFTYNRPLADLAAWSRIEHTLEQTHKRFGGYITSYWPMFNFMNAGLGYFNGGRVFWEHGGTHLADGYCVFWERGKVDWWTSPGDLTPRLQMEVGDLESRGDGQCVSYRAYWNHAITRTLCHVCQ